PSILADLTVPLLGAVDTAVMGHLPDPAYVGAVAVGAMIFSFLYWGFGFLRMGTVGFTAQAWGRHDADEIRAVLGRALLIGGVIAAALIVLQAPARFAAFAVVDAEAQVETFAATYFSIRIWDAPATLANYAILGWMLGMQMPRRALAVQVTINGVNIALDLLFVVVLEWGVAGVAGATVIAQYAGALLGMVLVAGRLRELGGTWQRSRIVDLGAMAAMMRVNRDIFIRTICMILAWSWFTWKGAAIGTLTLAGNALLMNFQSFLAHGLDGFAHATSALVGEAKGAGRRTDLRRAVAAATVMAALVAVGYTVVYAAAGPSLVALLTDIPELRAFAGDYLVWIAVSPLLSIWAYQLDGIFIGATRSAEMRNGMVLSLAAYAAAMMTLPDAYGNDGLWLSILVFMVARALTLAPFYPRIERNAIRTAGSES
ncbi:MAG: MATE family efflux transporter, partial [Alphaproteobacteria bacterium]